MTRTIAFRVELFHEDEWLRWSSPLHSEKDARDVLATVRSEYPHKRARIVRLTTTEEEVDGA